MFSVDLLYKKITELLCSYSYTYSLAREESSAAKNFAIGHCVSGRAKAT